MVGIGRPLSAEIAASKHVLYGRCLSTQRKKMAWSENKLCEVGDFEIVLLSSL